MTPQELKNSILQLAIQGKLVEQRPEEGTGEELFRQIQTEKGTLMLNGKKVRWKVQDELNEADLPYDVPDSWKWVRLGDIISIESGKGLTASQMRKGNIPVYGGNGITGYHDESLIHKETVVIGRVGFYCGSVHVTEKEAWVTDNAFITTFPEKSIDRAYLVYMLQHMNLGQDNNATAQPVVSGKKIYPLPFPVPPLAEQKRIVAKIEELLPLIDRYEQAWAKLEDFNKRFPGDMQKSILQMAIQGKLVEQRPEEGTVRQLLDTAVTEDNVDGQRVKQKTITDITDEDIAFEIPNSWQWIKLGNICTIARGGSPRPIKDYITTANDGVNWIKIGDTEKNGKYISSTVEKIKPAGVSKSRMVHAGDFLLTNSMSFGRPYILKIDGCIHDGWLVISQSVEIFDQDYLYWMLSSGYAYSQFCGKVSGAVVKNLNSDKVANSVFPLPPIAEQKRIVARLEELLPLCERLKS